MSDVTSAQRTGNLAGGGIHRVTPSTLVGTWRLVTWQTQQADGGIGYPFGDDALGLIIYTSSGYVSGQMMRANRPAFTRPRTQAVEFDAGAPDELAAAFNSFLAYVGRWTLSDDGSLRHHVQIASIPGWAGTILDREVSIKDGRLELRTPPRTIDGVEQRGVLVWERARIPGCKLSEPDAVAGK